MQGGCPSEGAIDSTLVPDPIRGQALYAVQCAACHGDNGEGRRDASGDIAFRRCGATTASTSAPAWRLYKIAGFVKHNMPPAVTREPPLGQQVMPDQDAVDIASYFINQPRPDFANKAKDWPRDQTRTRGTEQKPLEPAVTQHGSLLPPRHADVMGAADTPGFPP